MYTIMFNAYSADSRSGLYTPERSLPGGARVVGVYNDAEIQGYQPASFMVEPNQATELDPSLQAMLGEVRRQFPNHSIDVQIRREAFLANTPSSLPTHDLGIHMDGFKYGFFVFSTDEPTVFYKDRHGADPTQAKPGELVYVPGDCQHSSPNPTDDGERVRIKFIPWMLDELRIAPIGQFVTLP